MIDLEEYRALQKLQLQARDWRLVTSEEAIRTRGRFVREDSALGESSICH